MCTPDLESMQCCIPPRVSMFLFLVVVVGCSRPVRTGGSNSYPPVPPVCFVEEDPAVGMAERLGKLRPTSTGEALVIPLYRGAEGRLAIAHSFIYQQGDDIEGRLTAIGSRDRLAHLVLWTRGFFPVGIPRIFRMEWPVGGREMEIVGLQRCVASEDADLSVAVARLVESDQFVTEQLFIQDPPHPSNEMTTIQEPYRFGHLIRATEYHGRFWRLGSPTNRYLLWGFPPGTVINNRLTAEEKKRVTEFLQPRKPVARE
jgi:hypothetical protein